MNEKIVSMMSDGELETMIHHLTEEKKRRTAGETGSDLCRQLYRVTVQFDVYFIATESDESSLYDVADAAAMEAACHISDMSEFIEWCRPVKSNADVELSRLEEIVYDFSGRNMLCDHDHTLAEIVECGGVIDERICDKHAKKK